MLLKIFTIFVLTIACVTAEPPTTKSGPYPASGWRPRRPFHLPPRGYLPPNGDIEEQNQQPAAVNVEVNRERVEFAGQTQDQNQFNRQPHTNYGPPRKDIPQFLNQPQLPFDTATPRYQPTLRPQNQSPTTTTIQPQPTFFPTKTEDEPSIPSREYGVPRFASVPEDGNNPDGNFNIQYPDARNLEHGDHAEAVDKDTDENVTKKPLTPIEALNAAIDEYNRALARSNRAQNGGDVDDYNENNRNNNNDNIERNNVNNAGYPYNENPVDDIADAEQLDQGPARYTMGQYFILGPDYNLQRVMYTTYQNDLERQSNGFTAQLKYQPVGAVKDPIFRYNTNGQLIRILKK